MQRSCANGDIEAVSAMTQLCEDSLCDIRVFSAQRSYAIDDIEADTCTTIELDAEGGSGRSSYNGSAGSKVGWGAIGSDKRGGTVAAPALLGAQGLLLPAGGAHAAVQIQSRLAAVTVAVGYRVRDFSLLYGYCQ